MHVDFIFRECLTISWWYQINTMIASTLSVIFGRVGTTYSVQAIQMGLFPAAQWYMEVHGGIIALILNIPIT